MPAPPLALRPPLPPAVPPAPVPPTDPAAPPAPAAAPPMPAPPPLLPAAPATPPVPAPPGVPPPAPPAVPSAPAGPPPEPWAEPAKPPVPPLWVESWQPNQAKGERNTRRTNFERGRISLNGILAGFSFVGTSSMSACSGASRSRAAPTRDHDRTSSHDVARINRRSPTTRSRSTGDRRNKRRRPVPEITMIHHPPIGHGIATASACGVRSARRC